MTNQEKAIYAILADNVYWDVRSENRKGSEKNPDRTNSNWTPIPSDWKIIHEVSNSGSSILSADSLTNGFTARAFQKGNEIVIAFAGTNPLEAGDIASDIQLGIGTYSNQANSASIMYHEIKEKYPDADIKFTGHSLGGGLAGIMGILFDKEAIIFDPAPFKKSVMETNADENINIIKKLKKRNIYTMILDYVAEKYTESNINAIKKALEEQIEKNKEANQGFTEIDKNFLNYNYEKHYSQRVEKLTAIAVKGEFLSILDEGLNIPESVFKVIPMSMIAYLLDKTPAHFKPKDDYLIDGLNSPVNDGIKDKMGFAGAKHSQTLLALALLDENFEHYTSLKDSNNANIHTLGLLLDDNLYNYKQTSSNQNFLTKLIRSHIGSQAEGAKDYATGNYANNSQNIGVKVETSGKSLLTDFGTDLKNLAETLKPYQGKYTQLGYNTLIVQAIEYYYHQDIKTYNPEKNKTFFQTTQTSIQYTADTTHDNKAHPYAQKWLQEINVNINTTTYYEQWNIALDNNKITAFDKDKSQIFINLNGESHFIAGNKNDTLVGNHKKDILDGGLGNDTLIGGDDYDSYHIQDKDTIIDTDGKGQVSFGAKTFTIKDQFEQLNTGFWLHKDEEQNQTTHTAIRENNDLIVTDIKTQHQVTIKNYFIVATTNEDSYIALDIKLENKYPELPIIIQDPTIPNNLITDPNYSATIYANNIQHNTNIITSNKADLVFAMSNKSINANLQEGNDAIYGGKQSDKIHGGAGNDIIYGSAVALDDATTESQDHDIIIGGTGQDLIHAVAGNDQIYTEELTSHTLTTNSNQKGDWVLGGKGNDKIYGSENRDFLQGGKDQDIIYGGASDDIILGDGNIRFGSRNKSTYNPTEANIDYAPIITPSPFVPPIGTLIINPPTQTTHSIEYNIKNGNWQGENQNSLFYRDADTFNWDVSITADGHYTIQSKLATAGDKAQDSTNAIDILYGGHGNDLIIGQYGDDLLFGEEGDDILWGDDNELENIIGNDWLNGGTGNDTLHGGKGDDNLTGGSGKDTLIGGEGHDTYNFSKADLNHETDIKTIIDSDNNGQIIIDNINLSHLKFIQNDIAPQLYQADNGLSITHIDNQYIIQSNHFAGTIKIQSDHEKPLGIQLIPKNQPPIIQNPQSDIVYTIGNDISLNLSHIFSDPDNDSLTYSLQNTPNSLNFNTQTGQLTGTMPHTNTPIIITATDKAGASVQHSFNLIANLAPKIQQPSTPFVKTQNQPLNITLTDIFSDNDNLTYQIHNPNLGIILKDNQITLDNRVSTGKHTIHISATDSHNATASTKLDVQVVDNLIQNNQLIMTGSFKDDMMIASSQKGQMLNGLIGNDYLLGNIGNDTLMGGIGNDTLSGGKGNDCLDGGFGNDVYLFNRGDGQDRIFDISGNDTIKFGNGIDVKDIWFAKKGIDLNISLIGSDDSVTIEGFFLMPNQRVENFMLDNGKSLSANHVDNVVKAMFAHSANEFNFNDVDKFWVG